MLELLIRNGVAEDDIMLARLDEIGPIKPGRTAASLIWADIVGQARVNARPVARYLVFMVAAGIIAAFGVIQGNDILIVGAMAVSPDLLRSPPPVCRSGGSQFPTSLPSSDHCGRRDGRGV